MKAIEEHFKQWLLPVVFGIWTGFLIYLLTSQTYLGFLRPEFGLLLAVALLIALRFMFTAMKPSATPRMNLSDAPRVLVLLVPILYSMVMPDAMLGSQVYKKRFVGILNKPIAEQNQFKHPSQWEEIYLGKKAPQAESRNAQKETSNEKTITEIFRNSDLYIGKRVTVTGMIMHDEEFQNYFGALDTVVYRFMITCCAADARPVTIVLDLDQKRTFAKDQWAQVSGTFEFREIKGKPVPVLTKPRIKLVEAPEDPYLF